MNLIKNMLKIFLAVVIVTTPIAATISTDYDDSTPYVTEGEKNEEDFPFVV